MQKITSKLMIALAIAAFSNATADAAPNFTVTEIYVGIDGEDGTQDWFEVTNLGDMNGDTATLFFDDDNPMQSSGGQLDSFILGPGESAVFLIGNNTALEPGMFASAVEEFEAVWGTGINVGVTNGGGNLGQGGDSVNLSTDGGLNFTTTVVTPNVGTGSSLATLDYVGGSPVDSVLGVNGAYQSNTFFNNNLGLPNDEASLVGSPGLVPEPATLTLLGLGAVALIRRRR